MWASQAALMVKNLLASAGDIELWVQFLSQEDPLEEGRLTHCSIPAWRIPWTKEPGGIKPIELQRVGHCQEAFNKRLPVCCFGSVRNPLALIDS